MVGPLHVRQDRLAAVQERRCSQALMRCAAAVKRRVIGRHTRNGRHRVLEEVDDVIRVLRCRLMHCAPDNCCSVPVSACSNIQCLCLHARIVMNEKQLIQCKVVTCSAAPRHSSLLAPAACSANFQQET